MAAVEQYPSFQVNFNVPEHGRVKGQLTVQSAVGKSVQKPILQSFELRWEELRPRYATHRCHGSRTLLLLLVYGPIPDAYRSVGGGAGQTQTDG